MDIPVCGACRSDILIHVQVSLFSSLSSMLFILFLSLLFLTFPPPLLLPPRRPVEGRVVTALGKHWHIEHFACAKY